MADYPALDLRYARSSANPAIEDLLYAELDAFEPLAIHQEDDDRAWRVFFRSADQRDAARSALAAAFGDQLLELSAADVDDEDWARRSQAALTAITVGGITVAPPWDIPRPGSPTPREAGIPGTEPILIVIEPSMGFGTGHHATTRLCLRLLQSIDVRGKRVIDAGTGSGVLAMAAWKLGAASVLAMDYDPDALQNARENMARNAAADAIAVLEADLQSLPGVEPADIVLANLTGAVLQRHARAIRTLAKPDASLIVSGFSPGELDDVVTALGLVLAEATVEGEWAAALTRSC